MIFKVGDALRPSERLTLLALGSLLGLTLGIRPEGWGLRAIVFLALSILVVCFGQIRPWHAASVARDFVPVATVLGVFLLLQPLVATVNPIRWDAALAAVDARWFDGLAAAWRGAWSRPAFFTDLVYAAYGSFYLLPLSVAVLARLQLGPEGFERVAFTILLGFYLSFLGYFLWPAEGPRVPQILESAQLGGGAISQAIRAFLRGAETTTLDAFPSGHTALSIVPAFLATRRWPRLAPVFWAWALAIVFATVYIHVHYVVDVAAGLVLAVLVLAFEPRLWRLLGGSHETLSASGM